MLSKKDIKQKLRAYICTELLGDPNYPLKEGESLIESGLVDSFALARVGVFVEQTFDLYIPDSDLTVAKLDTLTQMTNRVYEGLKLVRK